MTATSIKYLTESEMEGLIHNPAEGQRIGRAMTRRLHTLWASGDLTGDELGDAVTTVWFQSIYPLAWLPASKWAAMFNDAGYRVNGRAADRPIDRVTLYRGVAMCRNARRQARKLTGLAPELGWSWTDDFDEAKHFALSRTAAGSPYEGPCAVYQIDAPPSALLARIKINREHVVNTAALDVPPAVVWPSTDL